MRGVLGGPPERYLYVYRMDLSCIQSELHEGRMPSLWKICEDRKTIRAQPERSGENSVRSRSENQRAAKRQSIKTRIRRLRHTQREIWMEEDRRHP